MKWILILMVFVNVGFAVWRLNFAAPVPDAETTRPLLPGQVNRLLLIEELEEERLRERVVADQKVPVPAQADVDKALTAGGAPPVPRTPVCFSIGPLEDRSDTERVRVWLTALGGDAELRESERREVSRYWVYFPPLPSRAEALKRVEEMTRNDIDDLFVISRGDMSNAISLGLYQRVSSRDRRLRELEAKGYEPSTTQRFVSKKADWYDVRFEPGFTYPQEAFARSFPNLQAAERACG